MSAGGTFTGTNYALQTSPVAGTMPNGKLTAGHVYCATDTCYASGTSLGAGSTMTVGKLPKGAVVLSTVVYPIDSDSYGAPDAMTNAVTGTLGTATDADLFGDVGALNSATPQVIAPKPDGTTITNPLVGLTADANVIFTSASAELVATEGICVKIFYTV